jgi:hypothetical protein
MEDRDLKLLLFNRLEGWGGIEVGTFVRCLPGARVANQYGQNRGSHPSGGTGHVRRLEIRWVRKEQELRSCQIPFVSRRGKVFWQPGWICL